MPVSSKCPICRLSPDHKQDFDSRLAMGLPATALADFLSTQGVLVTPQQVYSHKKHSKVVKPQCQEVIIPTRISKQVSEDGLTNDQRQQRIQDIVLNALDNLADQFEQTGNLRVARVLIEMADLANKITNNRLDREQLPDPNISVSINLMSLEEQLGLPEVT